MIENAVIISILALGVVLVLFGPQLTRLLTRLKPKPGSVPDNRLEMVAALMQVRDKLKAKPECLEQIDKLLIPAVLEVGDE